MADFLRFPNDTWAEEAANIVQAAVRTRLDEVGQCSIMLTGGRAGQALYKAWRNLPGFRALKNLNVFWGDERCVSPKNTESNYRLVLDTLFDGNPRPKGKRLFRMEAESLDLDGACLRYEKQLPDRIDVMLLGVGEDGHVASLFPGCSAVLEQHRRVVPVMSPKSPVRRITITPPVIHSAARVIVLAPGPEKAALYARLTGTVEATVEIPANLVASALWVMNNSGVEN